VSADMVIAGSEPDTTTQLSLTADFCPASLTAAISRMRPPAGRSGW
jgi:hypothetical protein